jgi:hypothetical protein
MGVGGVPRRAPQAKLGIFAMHGFDLGDVDDKLPAFVLVKEVDLPALLTGPTEEIQLHMDLRAEHVRAIPLWLTEGQKKADSLASHDAAVVDLLGVWNFKGKNPFGGVTVLADLDYIAFNAGREVRIVYDSDVMVNPRVRSALERLTELLRRRGSVVRAVYLPHVHDAKTGVDDFLTDHTLQDLEALIEAPRTQIKPTPALVELLDDSPLMLRRPLALIAGRAYAAIWPWVKVTVTEVTNKAGEVIKLQVPEVTQEQRLALVRDDGVIFGTQMDQPFEALGFEVKLPEIPATTKLWQTRSVKAYRQKERPEPKAVFLNVKKVVDGFLDFNRSLASQDTMCEMVACYILATWFLDAFPVIGYLWPNGTKGSGKTKLLTVIAELAYLGQMLQAGGTLWICSHDTGHMWEASSPHLSQRLYVKENQS